MHGDFARWGAGDIVGLQPDLDRDAGHGGHTELRRAADDGYNCAVIIEIARTNAGIFYTNVDSKSRVAQAKREQSA